jgi:hypothetical protein
MEVTTFTVTVFCLIDDWLAGQRLRQRGPAPILADSEVLTIECVGEFLGLDTDTGLDQDFGRHWGDWFPALAYPPHHLHRPGGDSVGGQAPSPPAPARPGRLRPAVSLVDSVAVPICRFARADRCRRLRELAAWGHDEVAKQTDLGLRAHLRCAGLG